MIYSLQRVKQQLRVEIEKYDILVNPENHAVGWGDMVTHLNPYTPSSKCRTLVLHYIKLAKSEAQRKLNENQVSLFE